MAAPAPQDSSRYIDREHDALRRLHAIAAGLNAETDPKQIFRLILDGAIRLTRAERGYLILVNADATKMRVAAAAKLERGDLNEEGFKFSRTIIREAIVSGQPLIVPHAMTDELYGAVDSVTSLRLGSVAAFPLKRRGVVFGALYLDNRRVRGLFKGSDVLILDTFTSLAVLALREFPGGPR